MTAAYPSNFRETEGQLARWQEALANFDFDVLYRPGAQHVNADVLSRIPMREPHESGGSV